MGNSSTVAGPKGQDEHLNIRHADALDLDRVIWYKEPQLRKLYCLCIFLLVASATTGYDGMMVNTSQQMDKWKEFFPQYADANKLGVLINMYNIGSVISFLVVPYMADYLGRKITIAIGCVLMILGAFVGAFSTSYGSKFQYLPRLHL